MTLAPERFQRSEIHGARWCDGGVTRPSRRGLLADRASAARRFAVCTAISASEPQCDRCVTPPSHQRAAWIFNPRLCASFRASTSASVVELTRVLQWICMTLLLACDITIAASVRELRHDGRTLAHANSNTGV